MSMVEEARDVQKLVSDEVVETKYLPHREMRFIDKPDEWEQEFVAYPRLGITEDDGLIVTMTWKVRKDLRNGGYAEIYLDEYGREFGPEEKSRMPDNPRTRAMVPNKAWDGRVTGVQETDGPEQRRVLLQSHEQAKLQAKKDKDAQDDSQRQLADAIAKLAESNSNNNRRGPGRPRKDDS